MDYKRLGERIREERLKLNLTQAQVAEHIDISDGYMGAIERGERSLALDTLIRLANRLGVTVDYLLQDYVPFTDESTLNQLRQLIDSRSDKSKQMAVAILRSVFLHLDDN